MPRRSAGSRESLAAVAIFRVFSAMECTLWLINSIVRFWGIIIGRVGQFFWPCLGIVGLCEGSGARGQGSEIRGQVSGVETGSMLLK